MLKITPYLGSIVIIVSIAGFWYPKLGYVLLIVFGTLMTTSLVRGRWFCGNLCPRGSLNDFWIGKIAHNKKIPQFLRSIWFRSPLFIIMVGFMLYRIIQTEGMVDKIGMVFVTLCLFTTLISTFCGIFISPRTWCTFCPMGTLQQWFGGKKYPLKVDVRKCINCGLCEKACPMQLKVKDILHNPDCIKCGRCIAACPKHALNF